jgi:hypothetical protein
MKKGPRRIVHEKLQKHYLGLTQTKLLNRVNNILNVAKGLPRNIPFEDSTMLPVSHPCRSRDSTDYGINYVLP